MKTNDLAERFLDGELPKRGFDDWAVDLTRVPEDLIYPWRAKITTDEGREIEAKGGSAKEAWRNAKYSTEI